MPSLQRLRPDIEERASKRVIAEATILNPTRPAFMAGLSLLRGRAVTADTGPGRKSGEQTTKSTRVPFRRRHCSLIAAARSPGKTHPDVRRIPNRLSLPQQVGTDTLVLPCQ
jgi:hypothetical protein